LGGVPLRTPAKGEACCGPKSYVCYLTPIGALWEGCNNQSRGKWAYQRNTEGEPGAEQRRIKKPETDLGFVGRRKKRRSAVGGVVNTFGNPRVDLPRHRGIMLRPKPVRELRIDRVGGIIVYAKH